MKKKSYIFLQVILSILIISLIFSPSALAWENGDSDDIYYGERFGSHDWIALEANGFLPLANQTWLNNYIQIYLRGTSAPDSSSVSYNSLIGYGDTTEHHNFYNSDGTSSEDNAATRAQEEYTKALYAMQNGKYDEGAWYAGCMTHYIADLAVWGHVMSNETVHSLYEGTANTRMDTPGESYFQITFDGFYNAITAHQASLDVGWETYRGDVLWQYNCCWMDANYHSFTGEHPTDAFEQRAEYLIELCTNKITDLLYSLSYYYDSNYIPPRVPGFEIIIILFSVIFLVSIYFKKKSNEKISLK